MTLSPPPSPRVVVSLPLPITVHFDYSGSLPHGGATWGAVLCQGDHHQELGGFLGPPQASEEGALEEVLRLLATLDIHAAVLFTDDAALVTRRASTLPALLRLEYLKRSHPRQRWAHAAAQRYRPLYSRLAEWGRQQPRPVIVPPPPRPRFAPLSTPCTLQYRRNKKGAVVLDVCLEHRRMTLSLGHLQGGALPFLPPQQSRVGRELREILFRGYGPEIEPYVPAIEARLLHDCAHLRPTMALKRPPVFTIIHPTELTLGQTPSARTIPVLEAFSCRRVSPTQVRLSYARIQTTRVIHRPAAQWAEIISALLLKAGLPRHEIEPHLKMFVAHLEACL